MMNQRVYLAQGRIGCSRVNVYRCLPLRQISILVAGILCFDAISEPLMPAKREAAIAKVSARIIASEHYIQYMFDDEISANLFDEYIRTLDPNRLYFRRADIDYFSGYKRMLDDFVLSGDVELAYDIYATYIERIREWSTFTETLAADAPLDFTVDESYRPDRSAAPWCRGIEESQELWRLTFKNDVLLRMLGNEKLDSPETKVLRLYQRKLRDIETNTVSDILEIFLSSLARVYDPHSSYMSPTTRENFDVGMNLSLQGIGAGLAVAGGQATIVRILPGGPADLDGRLRWGDRIIAVAEEGEDFVDVVNLPLRKIVGYIRGPRGTRVHLQVLRVDQEAGADPEVIDIVRDTINLAGREATGKQYDRTPKTDPITDDVGSVEDENSNSAVDSPLTSDSSDVNTGTDSSPSDSNDDDAPSQPVESAASEHVAVIALPSFYAGRDAASGSATSSARDVRKRIRNTVTDDTIGLVIDLRSNGGGSLANAIEMAGLFVKEGPIVQVRDVHGRIKVHSDDDGKMLYDGPLVVLVNRYSASASEIFAAAIQDHCRGVIVGDATTHGKGTVQSVRNLKRDFRGRPELGKMDPGSLKLTIGKFYRVNGGSTQRNGVTPDIILPSARDIRKIGESHLRNALFWDQVEPRLTLRTIDVRPYLPILRDRSAHRIRNNDSYIELLDDLQSYKKNEQPKIVSLLPEKRREQVAAKKKWRNRFRRHERREDDLALQEAMRIVSDLAELSEMNSRPSSGP